MEGRMFVVLEGVSLSSEMTQYPKYVAHHCPDREALKKFLEGMCRLIPDYGSRCTVLAVSEMYTVTKKGRIKVWKGLDKPSLDP
jgi:hypothetical protein